MDITDLKRVKDNINCGYKSHHYENETHKNLAKWFEKDRDWAAMLKSVMEAPISDAEMARAIKGVLPAKTPDGFKISYSAVISHVKRVKSQLRKESGRPARGRYKKE